MSVWINKNVHQWKERTTTTTERYHVMQTIFWESLLKVASGVDLVEQGHGYWADIPELNAAVLVTSQQQVSSLPRLLSLATFDWPIL